MMKSKGVLALSFAAAAVLGTSVMIARKGASLSLSPVMADPVSETRRVWILSNTGNTDSNTSWWDSSTLWVYAWNSSGNTTVSATKLISGYYNGLSYADVTIDGCSTDLKVIIRVGNASAPYSWGNNNQTFTQDLGKIGDEDVVWLNNGVTWDSSNGRNNRNSSKGTTNGFSESDMGTILALYDVCSASYANGYNSYPQMKTNFFDKTGTASWTGMQVGTETYEGNPVTVAEKMAGLGTQYTLHK